MSEREERFTPAQIADALERILEAQIAALKVKHNISPFNRSSTPLSVIEPIVRARIAQIRNGGYVTVSEYTRALHFLVTQCAICGKTAIYRMGASGRCREHRDCESEGMAWRRSLLNEKSRAIAESTTARDRRLRANDKASFIRALRNSGKARA